MTAEELLAALAEKGLSVALERGRIVVRPRSHLTPELRDAIREHRRELALRLYLASPNPDAYVQLATSELVMRAVVATPWLAKHRPDLMKEIERADDAVPRGESGFPDPTAPGFAEAVRGLERAVSDAVKVYEAEAAPEAAVRIYSRVLDAELWIATNQEVAEALRKEGVTVPIITPDEAGALSRATDADRTAIYEALKKIQRVFPGARVRSMKRGGDA